MSLSRSVFETVRASAWVLAVMTAAAPAFAQADPRAFTIEQLTERIIEGNRELKAALIARDAAQSAVTVSRALPNPRLEFNSGRSSPRSGFGGSGGLQQVTATQLVEFGAVRSARLDTALAGERGASSSIAKVRNDLVAQIRLGAFEALLRQEEALAAADALRLLDQVRERVRVRVDSGEAPRYEIIKADAEIITARQRRDSAALQAEKALLELNRLAGGTLPLSWRLAARLDEAPPKLALETLTRETIERSPELAILRAEVERARAQLQSAQASRWPGVEFKLDHSRDPEVTQNRVGISFSAPVLDNRASAIEQASLELVRAQRLLDGRRDQLIQEVVLAWKELEIALGAVDALGQGAVREAESALRVAEAAYRFGERGILEVIDAQRVLRSVRFELLQARFRLQSARISLEHLAARYAGD